MNASSGTTSRGSIKLTALLVVSIVGLGLSGCDSKQRGEEQTPSTSDPQPAEQSETDKVEVEAPKKSALERYTSALQGDGPLHAVIETSMGSIRCDLHEERAPLTVTNFVGLATGQKPWRDPDSDTVVEDKALYSGVVFHRVIPNFLIQSGDPTGSGTGGPGYTIPDEFHDELHHDRAGVLSMANRGEPDSGGSQWFILELPAPHLDQRHTVFGQCADLDVVRKISRVPTGPENRPRKPPVIESIDIVRGEEPIRAPESPSKANDTADVASPAE